MKTALAVLVLAAAAANAQEYRRAQAQAAEDSYRAMISAQASAAKTSAQSGRVRSLTVDSTLVALNDGVEAGGRVIAYLNDHKISVYTEDQAEPVKTAVVNGAPAIVLSSRLPARPRVYGPLIAQEAAKGMYADMPACGERSYMVMATAARVFAELGGDFNALPKVDGDDAPAVKDAVAPWLDNVEATVDDLAERDHVSTIPALRQKASDPKAAAALDAADKRFVAFLMDERDARRALK